MTYMVYTYALPLENAVGVTAFKGDYPEHITLGRVPRTIRHAWRVTGVNIKNQAIAAVAEGRAECLTKVVVSSRAKQSRNSVRSSKASSR